jgi:hypothetical protein
VTRLQGKGAAGGVPGTGDKGLFLGVVGMGGTGLGLLGGSQELRIVVRIFLGFLRMGAIRQRSCWGGSQELG